MNDRHLVALLKGREAATLKEWLKNHKKIKLVTRDRASSYALAISEVLPECVQVADRFHLLQNLIERMRDIFRDEIPDEIYIHEGKVVDFPPDKVRKYKSSSDAEQLNEIDYDNSFPVDENNNKFKLIKRILYGRANLDNLFKKCYIAFQTKKLSFQLSKFIKKDAHE